MSMPSELQHILCVDDEDDILEVTSLCLESIGGFRVTCCGSGADIVSVVERERPDMVLLDVMMPHMDGPSTLRLLQEASASPHVPVVFMTARVQPAEVGEYLELGAVGVVAKPFDPMLISAQVVEIWRKYQSGGEPPSRGGPGDGAGPRPLDRA
jgi:two-component system, OmpR family, response regulator